MIKFSAQPWIWLKGVWYASGKEIPVKMGDVLSIYTQLKCDYGVSAISVTVRLIVSGHSLGSKYKSIVCKGGITDVNFSATVGYTGNAKVEVWLGKLNNLEDTYGTWTLKKISEPAEGKIIAHNINKLPCPNCGSAKEGEEIEVIMGMKNIGGEEGEFRFYIYDQYGNELSREPDYSYKNVKPGDTWGVSKTLLTNLNFDMINKTLNGRVELRRQT